MKVAIDIDGTLTVWPNELGMLAASLLAAEHEVIILTGFSVSVSNPQSADMAALIDCREKQLQLLGLNKYVEDFCIKVCVGRNSAEVAELKGAFCRDAGVNWLIDDSPDYCAVVRRLSPGTLVTQVCR